MCGKYRLDDKATKGGCTCTYRQRGSSYPKVRGVRSPVESARRADHVVRLSLGAPAFITSARADPMADLAWKAEAKREAERTPSPHESFPLELLFLGRSKDHNRERESTSAP